LDLTAGGIGEIKKALSNSGMNGQKERRRDGRFAGILRWIARIEKRTEKKAKEGGKNNRAEKGRTRTLWGGKEPKVQ